MHRIDFNRIDDEMFRKLAEVSSFNFLVFLITCCRIIRISHLQISCCNKGCDVFGYIFV